MGWSAARKLRTALDNLTRVLAVELVTAARALDLRAPLEPGTGTAAAREALREVVEGPGPDRFLSVELREAELLVRDGSVLRAVEDAIGPLD